MKTVSVLEVLGQRLCAAISSDGTIRTFNLSILNVPGSSDEVQTLQPLSIYDTKGSRLTCMTAVSVKDDRTTTYAESVASGSDSEDSSDEDSDEAAISEQETAEAEQEAEAIFAQLHAEDEEKRDSRAAAGEDSEEEGDEAVEDEEEWGGIQA